MTMQINCYRTRLGLWLNWFRHDGRLFICLHVAVWAILLSSPRQKTKEGE